MTKLPLFLVFTLTLLLAGFQHRVSAQDPPPYVPPGFVLLDDLILPVDVLYGDSNYTATPWPGGVVPYTFNANVTATNQARAITAMAEWRAVANVTFVLRTTQSNYIQFISGSGNSSFVGQVGGQQNVTMVSWSTKYVICHELYHALGYLHEQSRPDRAAYVTINSANIQSGYANNFTLNSTATPVGPYDFLSIMHYPRCAFSIDCAVGTTCSCTNNTITCNPAYASFQNLIGQRIYMTIDDAQGLAARYGPPGPPSITGVSPAFAAAGSAAFTLTIDGTRFFQGSPNASGVQGSRILWDGTPLTTTYVDPTRLMASVTSAMLASAGCHLVSVDNPAPGGGTSAPTNFGVVLPPLVATALPLGTGCGGGPSAPLLTLSAPPVLGSSPTLAFSNAAANASGFVLFSTLPAAALPLGGGCTLHVNLGSVSTLPMTTSATGQWSLVLALPGDPCLEGFHLTLQAGVAPTGGPLGWDISNGLDIVFGF